MSEPIILESAKPEPFPDPVVLEEKRNAIIAAACMFACVSSWDAIHEDPITRPLAECMYNDRLKNLKDASLDYYNFVIQVKQASTEKGS